MNPAPNQVPPSTLPVCMEPILIDTAAQQQGAHDHEDTLSQDHEFDQEIDSASDVGDATLACAGDNLPPVVDNSQLYDVAAAEPALAVPAPSQSSTTLTPLSVSSNSSQDSPESAGCHMHPPPPAVVSVTPHRPPLASALHDQIDQPHTNISVTIPASIPHVPASPSESDLTSPNSSISSVNPSPRPTHTVSFLPPIQEDQGDRNELGDPSELDLITPAPIPTAHLPPPPPQVGLFRDSAFDFDIIFDILKL